MAAAKYQNNDQKLSSGNSYADFFEDLKNYDREFLIDYIIGDVIIRYRHFNDGKLSNSPFVKKLCEDLLKSKNDGKELWSKLLPDLNFNEALAAVLKEEGLDSNVQL